jgi:hypothetical protein
MKNKRTMHIPLHSCPISHRQSADLITRADVHFLALTVIVAETSLQPFQVNEKTR